jgi:hypothetical protein
VGESVVRVLGEKELKKQKQHTKKTHKISIESSEKHAKNRGKYH